MLFLLFLIVLDVLCLNSSETNCTYRDPLPNNFFPHVYHIPVSSDKVEGADNCEIRSNSFVVESHAVPEGKTFYSYVGVFREQHPQVKNGDTSDCNFFDVVLSLYLGDGYIPTETKYDDYKPGVTVTSWGSLKAKSKNGTTMHILVKFEGDNGDCYSTLWVSGFYFSPTVIATLIAIPVAFLFLCCCCCSFTLLCGLFITYCPIISFTIVVAAVMLLIGGLMGGTFGAFGASGVLGICCFLCCCCQTGKKKKKDGDDMINRLEQPLLPSRSSIQVGSERNVIHNNNDINHLEGEVVDHVPVIGRQLMNEQYVKDFNIDGFNPEEEEKEAEKNSVSIMNQPFLSNIQGDPMVIKRKPKPSRQPPKPPMMMGDENNNNDSKAKSNFPTISSDSSVLLNVPGPSLLMADEENEEELIVDNIHQEIDHIGYKGEELLEEEEELDETDRKESTKEEILEEEVFDEIRQEILEDGEPQQEEEEEEEVAEPIFLNNFGEEDEKKEEMNLIIEKKVLFEKKE